jgi:hypothetical protein
MEARETTMRLNGLVTGIVAGCAAVMISAMPGLAGQMPKGRQGAATARAQPQSGMAGDMAAKCQAMMAEREKMMAETKAADQRLDDLVGKMNAASGVVKADATAAVVSEMVTQDRTMRDGMMKMQDEMMAHMMEHMQAGAESLATCPTMKQMSGAKSQGLGIRRGFIASTLWALPRAW